MKKLLVMAALLTALSATPSLAGEEGLLIQESRGLVKQFFGDLKGHLVGALKSGGPVEALGTCSVQASEVAQEHSERSGWQIGRTSLKLRNPDNAPDSWERQVLEQFEQRLEKGEDPQKMEHSEILAMNGKRVFRYMKAIPTAEKPCLACHGKELSDEVEETIEALYPEDSAIDYEAGEIRGAFTLIKTF